jgi:glycosyltransferase involved in cell wall biosynthesis
VLRRERPDVVHSNDLPTHQMVSDAARRAGIPRICHHRWVFGGSAIDWLNKFGAERHLFVSRYLLNELSGNSTSIAAADRHVVYDGLPLPKCPDAAEKLSARKILELPVDRTIVLFAGQIIERKGVADLIAAWARLEPRVRDLATLVIVGDDLENKGAYRAEMERSAERLACPILFAGFQRDVSNWLVAADIAIVPSHVEPLGNATLEAMAHGLPVIGTRVGGIPEMIVADETGLLVAPHAPEELAAALERLIDSVELRRRLGLAGRRRCEQRFSLEAHVAEVVTHYEAVMRRPVGAGR